MQVVLLERVRNLGHLGQTVAVKPGYARNYLFPYGMAVPATKENIAHFEARRAELEKVDAEKLAQAKKRAADLEGFVVVIKRKTAEEGKLYGSVSVNDIMDALKAANHDVEKREVILQDVHIRTIGEYGAEVHLHSDVVVTLKVQVEAE